MCGSLHFSLLVAFLTDHITFILIWLHSDLEGFRSELIWYLFIFLLLNICVLIRHLWNTLIINLMWSYQKRILVSKVTRWLLTTFLLNNPHQTTANVRTLVQFSKTRPDQLLIDQPFPIISHNGLLNGDWLNLSRIYLELSVDNWSSGRAPP